jgi:hypothetical protein
MNSQKQAQLYFKRVDYAKKLIIQDPSKMYGDAFIEAIGVIKEGGKKHKSHKRKSRKSRKRKSRKSHKRKLRKSRKRKSRKN